MAESEIPSVFVKKDLLEMAADVSNDKRACEDSEEIDELVNFEIIAEENNTDLDTVDSLEIQTVPNGLIINDYIFLNTAHFNCIVDTDVGNQCAVCDEIIDDLDQHVNGDQHLDNLLMYPPLVKYDMSIVRYINSFYHCGVCNKMYNEDDIENHFESKEHEENILFSINKSSDLLDNAISKSKADCYHFKNENNCNQNENNQNNQNDYCYAYEKVDNFSYDDYSDNDVEDEFIFEPKPEGSYASKAKKPKALDFINVQVGNKLFKVNFDSYNMIYIAKENRFICMACKKEDQLSMKLNHCESQEHITTLEQFKTLSHFSDYYIRQIDNTHCHCAHCNKLRQITTIHDHIRIQHSKKPQKPSEDTNTSSVSCQNDNATRKNLKMVPKYADWTVVIKPFDGNVRLSGLHYNCIKKCVKFDKVKYFCCICEMDVDKNYVKQHSMEEIHIEMLMLIPFVSEYGNNLVRIIRDTPHCGICNTLIKNNDIDTHLKDPFHKTLLNITLEKKDYSQSDYINYVSITRREEKIIENQPIEEAIEPSLNESDNTDLDDSSPSVGSCNDFDLEEFVILKCKNGFVKVTVTSYNSLVPIGDSTRYCFVCSEFVYVWQLGRHVGLRSHMKNLDDNTFLEKYGDDLIRQMYLLYNCTICNSIIARSDVLPHISCLLHQKLKADSEKHKHSSKFADKDLKIYTVSYQKENIYLNTQEKKTVKIILDARISNSDQNDCFYNENDYVYNDKENNNNNNNNNVKNNNDKRCKVIMMKGYVLLINWKSFNSFLSVNGKNRCLMCRTDGRKVMKLDEHAAEAEHSDGLNLFVKMYQPNLIRKVNDWCANCVTCNCTFPISKEEIEHHIRGKKHKRLFGMVLSESGDKAQHTHCKPDVIRL